MNKIYRIVLFIIVGLVIGLSSCGKNKLKDVTFTKSPTTLYVGDEFEFEYTLQEGVSVEWSSSNADILSINDGIAEALKPGNATVTAKFTLKKESKEYTFDIVVKKTNYTIKYNYDEGELPRKKSTTFEEFESAFWPAFQEWYGNTGKPEVFKKNVLKAWSENSDGGYKVYLPGGKNLQDSNYFINDPYTESFWLDWFIAFDSQIKDINETQSAWDSTYVGYMRLYQFFNGDTSIWTEERRQVVYNAAYCSIPLISEYKLGDEIDLVNLTIDDGRKFLGWYDKNGEKIEKITPNMDEDLVLTAKWTDPILATSFELNKVDKLLKYDSFKLTWNLIPEDATFKEVRFISSNDGVLYIDDKNVMHGLEKGKVTVYYELKGNEGLSGSFDVEVYIDPFIDASFESTSVLTVGEYIKINAELKETTGNIKFTSKNESIATVDETGQVYGVSSGYAEIVAEMENNKDIKLVLGVTVLSSEEMEMYQILANAHNSEVYYVHDLNVAYDYDTSVACSVSDLYFNWEYKVNNDYFINPSRNKMSSIEFITVHYSGMPKAHQDGEIIATALYNAFNAPNWGGTSWHYSTGNDGIFHSMDESLVAWHAGDGTGTKFQWLNTGVKATSNTKPIFAVVENSSVPSGYSYSVNGEITNIEAPGNYRLTFYGPTWKIENGYYFMGNTYYNSDYKYISSRGGNLNSIGIESACNYGSDLWMTYHITAQLVARLLDKHNLDISRVQGHHTFSGKDCPQTLLEGKGELWYKFMELVEAELALYQNMSDYTITCESSNKELLDDNGRIVNVPDYTETVTYTLKVKNNITGVEKEFKFSSIVHGLYTL
jgi:N-acetylmuramoyl-L-alanine amidase CwlA